MAQAGFTPIQLYYSTTTTNAPSSGNLTDGELAINITDGKLFYKDNGGVVQTLANKNNITASTANTFTATQTFNGTSSTKAAQFLNAAETVNILGVAPTSTQNFYLNNGAVQFANSNSSTNWTLNVAFSSGTSLNTALSVGNSVTLAFLVQNGSPAYYQTAFTIDGSSVTVKWLGGTAPTIGNANAIDVYTFTIIKTASAVYTVVGSQSKYA
jgi:hypothetical protein